MDGERVALVVLNLARRVCDLEAKVRDAELAKLDARMDEQREYGGHIHSCVSLFTAGGHCDCGYLERLAYLAAERRKFFRP